LAAGKIEALPKSFNASASGLDVVSTGLDSIVTNPGKPSDFRR
jgi:hypothetical protein